MNDTISAILARHHALAEEERRAWQESYTLSEEMRQLEVELRAQYEAWLWQTHPRWSREAPSTVKRAARLAGALVLRDIWRERGQEMHDKELEAIDQATSGKAPT